MRNKLCTMRTALLPIAIASMLLSACGGKVLDFRNAQINNGTLYAGDANKPFSGTVTNVPAKTFLATNAGYIKLMGVAFKIVQASLARDDSGMFSICDVHADDGVIDGTVVCKKEKSDTVRIEAKYSGGILDGAFILRDEAGKYTIVEASFNKGEPDGNMKIYAPGNGKLVHTVKWKAGVLDGEEEGFDAETGNHLMHATFVKGVYEGELTQYAPDGKTVIYKGNYSHGQLNGELLRFDPKTGIKEVTHFSNGKLNGLAQAWDASGRLTGEKTYEDGVDVAAEKAEAERRELEERRKAEVDALTEQVQVATSDPDPRVNECVRRLPRQGGWSMGWQGGIGDERISEGKRILAWHDQCKANPDSQPTGQGQQAPSAQTKA